MEDKDLKKLIVDLKNEARTSWIKTKGLSSEEVQKIKDLEFLPPLDKLMLVALNSIEYTDATCFSEALKAFSEIYELTAREDLGFKGPIDEWENDQNGQHIKAKHHLSYSVPAKEVFMRFGVLATFATRSRNYGYIKYLCKQQIDVKNYRGMYKEYILLYPLYSHNSGQGSLTSIFDETRELINKNKILFEKYFDSNAEGVIDSQVEADLLIELYYFSNNIQRGGFRRFMNFPRFHIERLQYILDKIFEHPEDIKELAEYKKEDMFKLLELIIEFSKAALFNYFSDWMLPGVLQRLKEKYK